MPKSNNPLLDSLNLFFFLLLIKQNPHLLSNHTQNSDLHNPLLETKTSFDQKDNSEKVKNNNKNKYDYQKQKLKEHSFWDELYIHAKKVNYVQIKIMGDGPESIITGYLSKLHNDFITLIQKGGKINIPINKILILKKVDPCKNDLNRKQSDNINISNEHFNNRKRHMQKNNQLQLPLFNNMMPLQKYNI